MATKYNYSVSADFPNQKVDINKLTNEIRDSNITLSLGYINQDSNDCDIWFKADLSGGEETILNGIVAAHDGVVDPEEETPKTGPDNKMMVYESSRPLGTKIYFTCVGDNNANNWEVGGGQSTYFEHQIDDTTSHIYHIDFNTVENESYIHEGYIMWYGCKGDDLTLDFVPSVTPVTPSGGDSNYNLVNVSGVPDLVYGFMIVPAAPGTGNINVDSTAMVLVKIVPSFDYGTILDPGYWDADFNTTTKEFENITPNYTGTGGYNMFAAEVALTRFVNKMTLLDKGFLQLQTAESEQLPHNIRCRVAMNTLLPDHEWSCSCILVIHRSKTV